MSITRKGRAWEWLQSWWLLLAAAGGILTFLAFLFIGARTRTRKWLLWGTLYFVATVLVLTLTGDRETSGQWGSVVLFFWMFGLVHAFRARPEFLMRLEATQAGGGRTREDLEAMRREIAAEYGIPHQPPPVLQPEPVRASAPLPPSESAATPAPPSPAMATASPSSPAPPPSAASTGRGGVDLNAASEAELVALPGVGPLLARRVVRARESAGGFASVEDFGQALSLAPDFVDRLRPHVTLGARARAR